MRIDSAKRQNTEDLVKLMKVQPGMNMVGGINTVGNQKNRTRPKYGINNQGDSNFTGLYSNDLGSAQYQRRVGT